MIRWLPELAVRRPITMVMAFLALCVLGAIAYARIPLELMPGRFQLSMLWVWIPYPGATPRENESALLLPVEEQLSTLAGLKRMEAEAGSDNVSFSLEFHRSISMDEAYNAVVDRIERAMPDLPDDVDRYYVYRWNPSDEPIVWAGVSLGDEVEYPYHLAEELIKKRLERVDGVGQVEVWGADPRRIFIDFSLDALIAHNTSLAEVIARLGSDNFQMAQGRLVDRGQVRYLRALARYPDLDTLRRAPIGQGLVLDDVADVTYRLDPSASINRIDGHEGIGLAISKESDANTVSAGRAVSEALAELEEDPRAGGTKFFTFFDQGELIEESLGDLMYAALEGGFFSILVLYLFLRQWRTTLVIAAAIPFSLLLTITWLYFRGGSLNLLSLLGLMIAVGMVVDNATVVVEAIHARRQKGQEQKEAAIDGTADVALAITLSTLTSMVVFLPVILMSENADFSFFMGELGFPIVASMALSLGVALTFTPLSTVLLREEPLPDPRWVVWMTGHYQRWLAWLLRHRADTLLGIVAAVILTFLVPVKAVGCQEEAEGNIGQFVISYQIPPDFTYAERQEVVDTYEAFVEDHREEWGVEVHRSRLRATSTGGQTYVHLQEDPPEGTPEREAVIEQAKAELPEMPGVEAQIGWGEGQGESEHRFRILLRGEDTAALSAFGEELRRTIKTVPGVISAAPELESEGGEELRLSVNRDAAARSRIAADQIGRTVAFALRGTPLPDFYDAGQEIEVYGRFRLEDREDLGRLMEFPIFSPAAGAGVPLRALVEVEPGQGLGTIQREDRRTSWPITVDADPRLPLEEVQARVEATLGQVAFPRGVAWDRTGWMENEDNEAMLMALGMSVVLVFLIMGMLFESILMPLAIITSIPMALFGVYWTLYLTGTPLDVMGGVGLVLLVGVVVSNGIVLIDLVTRLREDGLDRASALVEGAGRRLRPILMTALTTIIGVIPMAIGDSTFIGIPYAPMGRVVAGGMIAGTVLTLFFVPYLYTVLDDMRESGTRWAAWVAGKPLPPREAEEPAGK